MQPIDHENDEFDDVVPINPTDDPFILLTDNEVQENGIRLQEALIVKMLVEDLSRGMYSIGRLREKFIGDFQYRPYPWLTPERFAVLLEMATLKIVGDNPIDTRFEIAGFLSSNLQLQQSLYDMLDSPDLTKRMTLEIVKQLDALKRARVEFIERTGQRLIDAEADPSKPSLVPKGSLPVTDLLREGGLILERTNIPDGIAGVLESSDIAEVERGGSAKGNMEEEQDAVHTASYIP